ncbi:hypothetical protein Ana3638_03305 [Anaerocolumna sedimenticola]|uniref:Uncharacterized protein n=1 Tax=Anaerocolumna sedimenticola TaxID=2696063 RepID=A0A6P1TI03_9FIRM|nr:hypothetical protein [Anaerocolumna sedimenticola]QHQ59927.1 hypothetical protein Ana3638_03305 [Anaerocolumna sedimenticola]
MRYLKSKKTAVIITSILVLISILYGSHHSLTKLRSEVKEVFFNGENASGKSINSDLEYISDECYNLTVVAGRYIDKDDERIINILNSRELLEKADNPGRKFKTGKKLIEIATVLYNDLKVMELSERDRYYTESFPVNVRSRELIISHNSYNDKAREFNRILKVFPANLLRRMTFVKTLELYE